MNSALDQPAAKRLTITYYTDPLCNQSWAFEPHWRRLRDEFGYRFTWRYQLSGLLPGWPPYPAGGPVSSQLACLAVKCAERQSQQAADLYLLALRKAALVHRRNIARPEVLATVADELAAQVPGLARQLPPTFDAAAFHQDFAAQVGARALWEEAQQGYGRYFPSLGLRPAGQPELVIALTGQPYEVLLQELAQASPDVFCVASLVEGGAG